MRGYALRRTDGPGMWLKGVSKDHEPVGTCNWINALIFLRKIDAKSFAKDLGFWPEFNPCEIEIEL